MDQRLRSIDGLGKDGSCAVGNAGQAHNLIQAASSQMYGEELDNATCDAGSLTEVAATATSSETVVLLRDAAHGSSTDFCPRLPEALLRPAAEPPTGGIRPCEAAANHGDTATSSSATIPLTLLQQGGPTNSVSTS